VLASAWNFDFDARKAIIIFAFPDEELPELMEHQGPPLSSSQDYQKFLQAHKGDKILTKNDRAYAMVKREFVKPEDFIEELILKDFIKSRVKKISVRNVIIKKSGKSG
jgi:tRNA nucleotidyltransferase (CCA-adding enzyme)